MIKKKFLLFFMLLFLGVLPVYSITNICNIKWTGDEYKLSLRQTWYKMMRMEVRTKENSMRDISHLVFIYFNSNIYVLDKVKNEIFVFDKDGNYQKKLHLPIDNMTMESYIMDKNNIYFLYYSTQKIAIIRIGENKIIKTIKNFNKFSIILTYLYKEDDNIYVYTYLEKRNKERRKRKRIEIAFNTDMKKVRNKIHKEIRNFPDGLSIKYQTPGNRGFQILDRVNTFMWKTHPIKLLVIKNDKIVEKIFMPAFSYNNKIIQYKPFNMFCVNDLDKAVYIFMLSDKGIEAKRIDYE